MHSRIVLGLVLGASCVLGALAYAQGVSVQRDVAVLDPATAQAQLERAEKESADAQARAEQLAQDAEQATQEADKTAREAAALAAQIQQAEADIRAAQARYSLAQDQRNTLAARLAERQQPLVKLTAALQTMSRRPLALSALQPGSLRETVYVRAVLDGAVPEVRQRTSALRQDLDRGRALEREARSALASLRIGENDLQTRRRELQNVEANQRLASRDARAIAARERELALALAEDARDLDGLIGELDNAAKLRRELAALPGPIMRPARPRDSSVPGNPRPAASAGATVAPAGFRLPVQGRTIVGFGAPMDSGLRSNGVEIAPAPGAQIVAPAAGRVAFSGPYRGFGRIVIIEHEGGWTSLVTGMEEASVEVGDTLVGGSPLGQAPGSQPVVSIELRRDGEPVNPLEFLD